MKVTVLLCDHVQEVAGKLYILGGGWSIYRGSPVTMGLAMKIHVPWDQANVPHDLVARLVTEDGTPPRLRDASTGDAVEQPIEIQGRFESGRPPGLRPGSELDAPVVVNLAAVPLVPGRYAWQILVDGEPVEHVAFTVL